MFLIWLIPVAVLIAVLVWMLLTSVRGRVRTARREDGQVLHDDEPDQH
jgi:cytochrome c-type biogenesis protein CcmH/NrfF